MREDLTIPSDGLKLAAWLYRPDGPGPHPIVVMAHGIGAVRQVRLPAYAERFRDAGLAVLCFDYRGWGDSEGEPRFVCDIAEQHRDIHAAVDHAKSLPGIDPSRVALWGTSFGGGHALVVAADRDDLSAVVAHCAVVDCPAALALNDPEVVARQQEAGREDLARAERGEPPLYVQLAGEPGSLAVLTKHNAEENYRKLMMEPSRWENKLAARYFLQLPGYRPIESADRIRAPLLILVTDLDEIQDGDLQDEVARRAPDGHALHYPASHFQIYFGEMFERAVADMTAFLRGRLERVREAA